MAVEVEIVNGPDALDIAVAVGTILAVTVAGWAAWIANRQNKRLTERRLHFASWLAHPRAGKEASIHLIITNDSFRPITLRRVGLMIPGTEHEISLPQPGEPPLDVTLRDGQASEWAFPFSEYVAGLRQHGDVVQYFAIDTRGVFHSAPYSGKPWQRLKLRIKLRYDNWQDKRRFKRELAEIREARKQARDS
jgi:hypothetical protein